MKTRRGALNSFIKARWHVKITRSGRLSAERGFPVAIGRSLAMVHLVDDFALEGYSILPLEDMTAVASESGQSFLEKAFRKEGTMSEVGLPLIPISLDGWEGALRSLAATGEIVIVECERRRKNYFFIGPIVGVSADAVGILYFDGDGVWDEEPSVIPYDAITRVRIGDPYATGFAKYLSPMPAI